MTSCIW